MGVSRPNGEEKVLEIFVPGRLCLFGEHSDWAGSMRKYNHAIVPGETIVVTTQQGLHARIRRRPDSLLVLHSTTGTGQTLQHTLDLADHASLAKEAQAGGFWSYAAGVSWKLAVDWGVGGLEVDNYATTLPLKRGLSSSAALCVLLARAFNRAYSLGLTVRGEMSVAYEGERLTPSQCGRMDQAVALGAAPALMRFDGDVLSVDSVQLACKLHLVLVDLAAGKDTILILSQLQAAYPHPKTPEHAALVHALGPTNRALVEGALRCMASGDAVALGSSMVQAQAVFDQAAGPLCPSQLGQAGSPVLHAVLALPALQPFILGGKGVGSQGDGTAQLLCRDEAAQAAVVELLKRSLGLECVAFTVPCTGVEVENGALAP